MKDKIIISVIVPIYGVEKYIRCCAESLFNQTLTDGIEFIFVDDASPDDSIKILEETLSHFPNRLNQIRILHHDRNKGLAQARRTGLSNANGLYILHFDSDDWMEPTMCETLLKKAISDNADVVVCDYYEAYPQKLILKRQPNDTEKFIENMLLDNAARNVWNKLIKRTVYLKSDINFPIANMGEDMVMIFLLLQNVKDISFVNIPLCYYRNEKSGMSNIEGKKHSLKRYKDLKENTELLISLSKKYFIPNYVLDFLKLSVKFNLCPLISEKRFYFLYIDTYKEINNRIFVNQSIGIKYKIKHLFAILGIFPLYKKLLKYVARNRD